ncbi:hypothetical protein [Nocardioides panacihumi]|uniref:hypothetical protein n=1 Tax=Nocardioides panacihumi TaxID=400774 RepID=UPI0031D6C803
MDPSAFDPDRTSELDVSRGRGLDSRPAELLLERDDAGLDVRGGREHVEHPVRIVHRGVDRLDDVQPFPKPPDLRGHVVISPSHAKDPHGTKDL